MVDDALPPPPRDARISDVFYYLEHLTSLANGRTVGRKIGVIQEVVLRKHLESSEPLRRRMMLEQRLTGQSGASHKVEFSWYSLETQTLSVGDEIPGLEGMNIASINETTGVVRLRTRAGSGSLAVGGTLPGTSGLRIYLDAMRRELRLTGIADGRASFDVLDRDRLLASLESKRVGAQRFSGNDHIGAGIQTIEKAKQASLVAIDLDIRYNGTVKPLQDPGAQKQLLSLVALGNGVHWTPKDRAILDAYVDYTYLVKDAVIIRYLEYIRALGEPEQDVIAEISRYFRGMTVQRADDFVVANSDFEIIAPARETRTLLNVLESHILAVDP